MRANLSIHSLERYLDERMSPGRDREHDLTLMQRATGENERDSFGSERSP